MRTELSNQILIATLLLQFGLFAAVWAGMAGMKLSRWATAHWAAGMGAIGVALALRTQAASLGPWLGFVGANLLGLAGFCLLRRGVEIFSHQRPRDLQQAILLGLTALALVLQQVLQTGASGGSPLGPLAISITLLAAAWQGRRALSAEFGASAAAAMAAPMLLLGVLLLVRSAALVADLPLTGQSYADPLPFNLLLGYSFMVAVFVLNVSFGGMVVLRLVHGLQQLSERDPLTGLLNRRGLERVLQVQADRLRRHGSPYALLAADVDHFKVINDRFGHAGGDAALVALSRLLQDVVRDVDHVARVGGEEFCLLLPDTDEAGARQMAERLLRAVRSQPLCIGHDTLRCTLSIGLAVARDTQEPLQALLHRADAAMYRAKEEGRDCMRQSPVAASASARQREHLPA